MICKLTHLGVQFVPLTSIDQKYWPSIRNFHNDAAVFHMYQAEGPGGLTLTYLDQDNAPDGEYDLPYTVDDFMEAYV